MASVDLKNVKKIYDNNVTAVESASLSVKNTEFIVLVGPSGNSFCRADTASGGNY